MTTATAPPPPPPLPALDPDSLKRAFKQKANATNNVYQNWQIRVHRSLSWSKRALRSTSDEQVPHTQK